MKPTVYIETTIPSYYYDEREVIAKEISRTREWWDAERDGYECFTSPVVFEELQEGSYPHQEECVGLVVDLPSLTLVAQIRDIAATYQARRLMPKEPVRDALHLAVASYYRMDFLLTWNCRHLANATKVRHLERLNQGMGLSVPILTTPFLMQTWEEL